MPKHDLFNNPMIDRAKKNMSKEQLDYYQHIGEEMYKNIDFTTSEVTNNLSSDLLDSVAYIEMGLKSGLQFVDVTEAEKNVLDEVYGNRTVWMDKYNLTQPE